MFQESENSRSTKFENLLLKESLVTDLGKCYITKVYVKDYAHIFGRDHIFRNGINYNLQEKLFSSMTKSTVLSDVLFSNFLEMGDLLTTSLETPLDDRFVTESLDKLSQRRDTIVKIHLTLMLVKKTDKRDYSPRLSTRFLPL